MLLCNGSLPEGLNEENKGKEDNNKAGLLNHLNFTVVL